MNRPTIVDVFCGIGGISKGFEKAGFEVILGIDSNPHAIKIFKKQHPTAQTTVTDIRNITSDEIKQIIGNRKIDVLVGGPPCQGFSVAARHNRDNEKNALFYEFVRLAKELKPSWVFIENVRGLASAKMPNGKPALDAIYEAFEGIYSLKHYFINAADFGVPQKRKRIIFVGNSMCISNNFILPKRKWKPTGPIILKDEKVDKKYFYSEKLISGFRRREKRNRERGLGFRWQFLKLNEPSYTIPARYWKDGANALVKYSETKIRMLTEKECAKIQGINPKLFKGGRKKMEYILIGNAVPPKISEFFATQISKKLNL